MEDKSQTGKKRLSNDRKLIIWNLWKDLCSVDRCNPDNNDEDLKYPDHISEKEYRQMYDYLFFDVLYKFSECFKMKAGMKFRPVPAKLREFEISFNGLPVTDDLITLFDTSLSEFGNSDKKSSKDYIWNIAAVKTQEYDNELIVNVESQIRAQIMKICVNFIKNNFDLVLEDDKETGKKRFRNRIVNPSDDSEEDPVEQAVDESEPELSKDDVNHLREQAKQDAAEFTLEEKICIVANRYKIPISHEVVENALGKKHSRCGEICTGAIVHLRSVLRRNNFGPEELKIYFRTFYLYIFSSLKPEKRAKQFLLYIDSLKNNQH